MENEIQLVKIRIDRDTREETLTPFSIDIDNLQSIYKDRNGCYVITKQGYMNQVPYSLNELQELFGL